jgi:hypothetical protein
MAFDMNEGAQQVAANLQAATEQLQQYASAYSTLLDSMTASGWQNEPVAAVEAARAALAQASDQTAAAGELIAQNATTMRDALSATGDSVGEKHTYAHA